MWVVARAGCEHPAGASPLALVAGRGREVQDFGGCRVAVWGHVDPDEWLTRHVFHVLTGPRRVEWPPGAGAIGGCRRSKWPPRYAGK